MATAGRHLSRGYLIITGVALALVVAVLAVALAVGAHPSIAERVGRRVAGWPGASGPALIQTKWAERTGGSPRSCDLR